MPRREYGSSLETLKIFSGNAHPALAGSIAKYMEFPLGRVTLQRFNDGEIWVEVLENIRNADVYLVQSLCPPNVNDNLMELLVMMDACRRASAASITVVVPYYCYARQDRKVAPRTPISAKLVADLLQTAGATRIIAMDLHAGQIQGYFNIPFDHIYALPVMLDYLRNHYDETAVIVSPDAGGVERARAFSKRLKCGLAIIDKRRSAPGVAEVMNLIGDVRGRDAIIVDDMIDTAGTLTNAAKAIKDAGARSVAACATHALFSGPAVSRMRESALDRIVICDTIPLRGDAAGLNKIVQLSVAPLLGEAIKRIHLGQSVSELFV